MTDIGSSFLPGELVSAFLLGQLENIDSITNSRLKIWNKYHYSFSEYEIEGKIKLPFVPKECIHNGHLYYLIFPTLNQK